MKARRTASFATVGVLTAALASGSGPAAGDAVRTETTLGGYSIKTNAAPLKVLLDDPASAIPHEPGSAILEADASYSQATLETGPASRGLASSLWPGALLGDGIGTATEGQVAGYPVKADARYPDKPYTANGHGCLRADQPGSCFDDGGAFMSAKAMGLDVRAAARLNPAEVPGEVEVGAVSSEATATVKDGVAIGTSRSQVSDLTLLGGVIKVGSVSTTLSVRSDGKKPTSSGSTVVTGLTIGGAGYVVDEQGARLVTPPGQPAPPGSGPIPTNGLDPAKQLGITVSGISQDRTQDSSTATRDAKGLRITVDTVVLRGVLDQATPGPVRDALYTIFSQVPSIGGQNIQGYLFYLLTTTPKITFVVGAGSGVSAATLPLSFDFPDLPVGGFDPPVPPTDGGTVPAGPVPASGPVLPGAQPTGPGPVVLPPTTVKAAAEDPFGGLPPGLLLLVLAAAGVAGWGMVRLQSAALLGAAAEGPCTDGSTPTLPDLRGA